MNPETEPAAGDEPHRWQLATYGWLSWEQARALLDGAVGAWLAPSGITLCSGDAWPSRMPLTTRIHAWDGTASRQWRLVPRPSRATVLVTCLVREATPLPASPLPATSPPATSPPAAPRTRRVAITIVNGPEWDRTWIREAAAVMFLRPAPGAHPQGRWS